MRQLRRAPLYFERQRVHCRASNVGLEKLTASSPESSLADYADALLNQHGLFSQSQSYLCALWGSWRNLAQISTLHSANLMRIGIFEEKFSRYYFLEAFYEAFWVHCRDLQTFFVDKVSVIFSHDFQGFGLEADCIRIRTPCKLFPFLAHLQSSYV